MTVESGAVEHRPTFFIELLAYFIVSMFLKQLLFSNVFNSVQASVPFLHPLKTAGVMEMKNCLENG